MGPGWQRVADEAMSGRHKDPASLLAWIKANEEWFLHMTLKQAFEQITFLDILLMAKFT